MEKDKRIAKEAARIKKLYKDLPKNRLDSLKKLIERAAFMAVSLEDMETTIQEEGQVVKMRQGECKCATRTERRSRRRFSR